MRNAIKHGQSRAITLSLDCSQCRERFRDGAARFILGSYPMEQFCSYGCAEKYLEAHPQEKKAVALPASKIGGNPSLKGRPGISFFPE